MMHPRPKEKLPMALQADVGSVDLDQRSGFGYLDRPDMKPPLEEPRSGQEAPNPKPSRLEEAGRIIQEYADDLREVMKLRRRLD
jgi:hypothetical protein